MKDVLIDFDDMKSGEKALRKIAQAFTRAGAPVVATDVDPKVKRSSGVSYRDAYLTFGDNQKLTLGIKAGGDVYQVKINGSVVPIKNQDDQKKAVAELVKHLDAGRAKFQQKLARVKAELPKGVRATAPKVEVALQQRSTQLDTEIAQAQQQVEALKAELGAAPSAPGAAGADGKLSRKQVIDSLVWRDLGQRDGVKTMALYFPDPSNPSSSAQMKASEVWSEAGRSGWHVEDEGATYKTLAQAKARASEIAVQKVAEWGYGLLDSASLDEARELAATILGGAILDSAGMDHALATLQIALDAAENNAPIYAAEGDADQAELCRESAQSFREAIAMLDSADEGEEEDGEEEGEEAQEPNEDQGALFDEADEEPLNPDQDSLFDAAPASVGNKLAEIGKTYWPSIPLDKIFAAVRSAGYEPVDEDGEPWEGMLTGREGRAVIDLQKSGKPVKEALALQWYKMESGKFEVNAYVS